MRVATLTLLSTALAAWMLSGCSDTSPPTWPDGAELEVKDVTATSATLDWPPASDDDAVAGYRIFEGEEKIADVGAGAAFHELADLTEATEHGFAIEAFDAADNASKRLELTFATRDGTPPIWPEGAELTAGMAPVEAEQPPAKEGEEQPQQFDLKLTWPTAADNVEVTVYRIKRGTSVLGEVAAKDENTFRVRTDAPDGLYSVAAGDAAGNWSAGLVATVGDLGDALNNALGSAGVLKLLGELGEGGGLPSLGSGKFDLGEAAKALDALPEDVKQKGLGGLSGLGIEPGSLLGKDSKLEAPGGDLTLELVEGDSAKPAKAE